MKMLMRKLSDENLALLPEYHQRVDVLRHRNYLGTENAVQLKVCVAGI